MKNIKIYSYHELNDAAKEAARGWWRDAEEEDPSWLDEHHKSLCAAIEAYRSYQKGDITITRLKTDSLECVYTGYIDDALLYDLIVLEGIDGLTEARIRSYFSQSFEDELTARLDSIDVIEEHIQMNQYMFFSDGSICPSAIQ